MAGWVTNREDGSVEAVFEGTRYAVEAIIGWCGRGPVHARVARVEVIDERPIGEHRLPDRLARCSGSGRRRWIS